MTDAKKGVQNPPADQNPEVKAAKAKVNPQAVGALLADNEAAKPEPTPVQVEESAKDFYAKELAPSAALVNELPLQGDEEEDETRATEPPADAGDDEDEKETDTDK